jgi:hypothetical protein
MFILSSAKSHSDNKTCTLLPLTDGIEYMTRSVPLRTLKFCQIKSLCDEWM